MLLSSSRWYQDELPKKLRAQKKIDKSDLVKLVDWKLTRGKWRPRLLDFAKSLDEKAIESTSSKAFETLDCSKCKDGNMAVPLDAVKEALQVLCELKGVGPATASAILSAYDPSIPFMSDEALLAVIQSKEYTAKAFVNLTSAVRRKAEELIRQCETIQWSSREVEKCLFAASKRDIKDSTRTQTSIKKRKRQ